MRLIAYATIWLNSVFCSDATLTTLMTSYCHIDGQLRSQRAYAFLAAFRAAAATTGRYFIFDIIIYFSFPPLSFVLPFYLLRYFFALMLRVFNFFAPHFRSNMLLQLLHS